MASANQPLRFAARSSRCTRIPTFHTVHSIRESRTFSIASPRRKGEKEVPDKGPKKGHKDGSAAHELRSLLRSLPPMPKYKPGFQNMSEDELGGLMTLPDEEFGEDDITSLAHGQLDEHRERREYLRIAAWEMPLLSEMAKPFVPPEADRPLRFRYTSYLGEKHPAEKKVVVEFCPKDMPLQEKEMVKLTKLLGPRYNPETEIAKISCEMYENQAQNKRYLGDLVDKLLEEARDTTDTFEDVPLDTRHHIFKKKPKFPREWRMDDERKAGLRAARGRLLLLDEQRTENGQIVDGREAIVKALSQKKTPPAPALVSLHKQKRLS